jgi:hypothetical protein
MNRFTKQLPALLSRTDVVLELRDSRLPLTSINNNLEGKLILKFGPFQYSLPCECSNIACSIILVYHSFVNSAITYPSTMSHYP